MRYIIVDLEATCWDQKGSIHEMEIIEIGAVELAGHPLSATDEFNRFVRPRDRPVLTAFCMGLTSIRQEDIDAADEFKVVFRAFLDWIGPEPYIFCSWGLYDFKQFEVECRRHGVPLPDPFRHHLNLKKRFAAALGMRPCGMLRALHRLGLAREGLHHRGIDDARNIARIAQVLLTQP